KVEGLIKPSWRMCLDVDKKNNDDMSVIREIFTNDEHTEALFASCSGTGLAVIVKIANRPSFDAGQWRSTFEFVENYYKSKYDITVDPSCKDVSRLRFVSYDPYLFFNSDAKSVTLPESKITVDFTNTPTVGFSDNVGYAKTLIEEIIKTGVLVGDDSYNSWLRIGFALVSTFGEDGREYFHNLSQTSPKYDAIQCDKKYDHYLRNNKGEIGFGTILHYAGKLKSIFTAARCAKKDGRTIDGTVKMLEEVYQIPETESRPVAEKVFSGEFNTKREGFNLTDLGNAKRLSNRHGDKIRYCHTWKKWLIWNGRQWEIDGSGAILRFAKDTVKHIYQEATLFTDDEQRKAIAKWAITSESESHLNSMVSLAQSEEGIPISPQDFDTDHYLLNCFNGTIDLKTGKLKPHDPKDFITKIIPVKYNPDAECPQWINFLETIFDWNYDLISFIQRAVGYSLTGNISEQCLFILHGLGGKR
ncbi:MAG: BT4734/BF3469 family protein, partial [Candidatus Brocadiaceae bacterium]